MEPHRKGDLTEAIVIAELKRRDIPVSVPFGDNERYDLLAEDDDGEMWRMQVKTGHFDGECVVFRGYSTHTNSTGNVRKSYTGDVDIFVVHCEDVDGLYLLTEAEVGAQMRLRVADAKQDHRTINWAADYAFDERWPPSDPEEGTSEWRDTVLADLRERDIGVVDMRETDAPYDALLRTEGDELYRTSIRPGSVSDGRIRFDTGSTRAPGPEIIDYVLVWCREMSETYLIRRDAYKKTITLRVAETSQNHKATNRAADYTLNRRWPPA